MVSIPFASTKCITVIPCVGEETGDGSLSPEFSLGQETENRPLSPAVLHGSGGFSTFHDTALYDESSAAEKEANLFAAELLMDDEKVLEEINNDGTFFTAAAMLNVPMELLDFKFRKMKWKGYKLVEPPVTSRSDFLKDVPIPENHDEDFFF